jgi:hypothetical protein
MPRPAVSRARRSSTARRPARIPAPPIPSSSQFVRKLDKARDV